MIVQNAGGEGSIVVEKVRSSRRTTTFGYNALTDTYENLVQAGVIDPTKVTRTALQNAASIAGLLLTTEAIDRREEGEDKPAAGGAGRRRHGRDVLGPSSHGNDEAGASTGPGSALQASAFVPSLHGARASLTARRATPAALRRRRTRR